MRVLILADDCNPVWPSLPVLGYEAARAIAEYADVIAITPMRNQENIEKAQIRLSESICSDGRRSAKWQRLCREPLSFACPSIRELAAGVVVVPMACGLACIVVDYGAQVSSLQTNMRPCLELSKNGLQTPHGLGRTGEHWLKNSPRARRGAHKFDDVDHPCSDAYYLTVTVKGRKHYV